MQWSTRGAHLFAFTVVMAALSTVAVTLRFLSRGRILHVLGPTDWFLAVTLVGPPALTAGPASLFSISNTAFVGAHVSHGLGWPLPDLSDEEQRVSLKIQYFAIIINNLSLVLTKISVALLFLDVFLVTSIRKATYVVLIAVILHGIYVTLTNIFFCTPINDYWDKPFNPTNKCIDPRTKFRIDNALNIVFNFVMLCLPVPAIWPMTLPWRQKLWLFFLFMLGFCVSVVSVLRVIFIRRDIEDRDFTTAAIRIIYWSIVEINLPIMIACVPTLTPLAGKSQYGSGAFKITSDACPSE
ncbi:hypothetical protein B0I37DRAFT_417577 [Chaetomium sp. MPI-CAGE-AT-0009]|nr:hypothetical protein B0I37DRAFT_417577 [Chaetomium sp. MPI-CAGE-AT-0009]